MKKGLQLGLGISLLLSLFVLLSGLFMPPVDGGTTAPVSAAGQEGRLPAALDEFYPPTTEEPVYLFKMIEMGEALGGLLSDLMQNDVPNVQAGFQHFKALYEEMSELIPEWKDLYPMAPLDGLEASFKTGDPGQIMAAGNKVGDVCTECHVRFMAGVQFKYGWSDFSSIQAKDPLTKEDLNLQTLMLFMEASFSGIRADLTQGQFENALQQFQGFKARFQNVAGLCGDCHGTVERRYFTDQGVLDMIDALGEAVADRSMEKTGEMIMAIGMDACHQCHLVHIPAAYAQKGMKK